MKPLHTLLFVLTVIALLAGISSITPKEGVDVAGFTFQMPSLHEMLHDDDVQYADVSNIINNQFAIDSLVDVEVDTTAGDSVVEVICRASYDSLVQSVLKIEMQQSGRDNLYRFFKHLRNDKSVRIMHYGDSQIEGDRITAFLRNKLQRKFGGTGIGLRPALQPYNFVFTALQQNSSNWKRYPIFGKVDTMVMNQRYGVMGAFSRYAPLRNDTLPFTDSVMYQAQMSISKTNISYKLTRKYENLRLFYGNAKSPVDLQVIANGDSVCAKKLLPDVDYAVINCKLSDTVNNIELQFSGHDSPDIYGVELASKNGVIVDNIALRGCSGTIFTKMAYEHSLKMYSDLNPKFIILQFGGNVIPYIKNQKAILRYGRHFSWQIKRLQKLCPDAAFLIIGPSDMSTKKKDKYITYKHLPGVVDILKKVSLDNGCCYWDMYEAMGGENSMPSWVNAQPELARPDYVHFSARGARLVANMFYNALILEYNKYLEGGKGEEE